MTFSDILTLILSSLSSLLLYLPSSLSLITTLSIFFTLPQSYHFYNDILPYHFPHTPQPWQWSLLVSTFDFHLLYSHMKLWCLEPQVRKSLWNLSFRVSKLIQYYLFWFHSFICNAYNFFFFTAEKYMILLMYHIFIFKFISIRLFRLFS